MQEVEISILIPTCGRPEALGICLNAVAESLSRVADAKCEVVVGNDGPPRDLEQLPAQIYGVDIVIIQSPRRGPAANRNALAEHAKGEILVFLDDDCVSKPDLIPQYVRISRAEPQVQVFEGKISPDRKARFAHEECPVNEVGGFLWSANMAVRRTAFMALGGFDEDYPYAAMEDVDFRTRAAKAGFTIRWCPEAAVCHPLEVRLDRKRQLKHRYSVLLFLNKHPYKLESVRTGCSTAAVVRHVKKRIFDRQWLQPLRAYRALAGEVYSTFVMHRIVKRPETISSELAAVRDQLKTTTSPTSNLNSSLRNQADNDVS